MLKSAILPAVLAIVVGLAGSAGYAVMQARTTYAAHVIVQDSIAKVQVDSMAADSAANARAAQQAYADSVSADSALNALSTPADSIRALLAQRNALTSAGAAAVTPSVSPPLAPAASLTPEAKVTPPKVVAPVTPPVAAIAEVLPERRLAKIFSAMSSKDAAKVLEQMSDTDIRTILSMMGDRQAAAVLTSLPASRAASITKAGSNDAGSSTP